MNRRTLLQMYALTMPSSLFALARGVNLSHSFAQAQGSPAHLEGLYTSRDLDLIRRANFSHVRLPFDYPFAILFWSGHNPASPPVTPYRYTIPLRWLPAAG